MEENKGCTKKRQKRGYDASRTRGGILNFYLKLTKVKATLISCNIHFIRLV